MSANCVIEMHDLNKKRFPSLSPQHEAMRPRARAAWLNSNAAASRPRIIRSRFLAHQETATQQLIPRKQIRSHKQVINCWVRGSPTEKPQVKTKVAQLSPLTRSPECKADFEQENQPLPFTNKPHLSALGHKNISHLADLSESQPTKVVESSTKHESTRIEQIKKQRKHIRQPDTHQKRARRAKREKARAERAQQRAALSPQKRTAPHRSKRPQHEVNAPKPSDKVRSSNDRTTRTERQADARAQAVEQQEQRATRTKQRQTTMDFMADQLLTQLKQLFENVCASRQQCQEHDDMEREVRRYIRQLEECIEAARNLDLDDKDFDAQFSAQCRAFVDLNATAVTACMIFGTHSLWEMRIT